MRNLQRSDFVCLAAVFITGCGPVFRTDYIFTPPDSEHAYTCTVQCESAKQNCLQLEQLRYERCEDRAEREYYWCENHKRYRIDSKGRRKCVENCWCFRESCAVDTEMCDEQYRNCYQACGGEVEARTICVSNCEKVN